MQKPPLTYQQQLRYSRHIMLPQLDIDGQEKIWQSHALIVGLGGLGCPVAQYLAASGVGTLTLVDNDVVDATNLQRQVLYKQSDVGCLKTHSAKKQLTQLNDEIEIHTIDEFLNENSHLEQLLSKVDVVIDCTDNLATRNLLNSACYNTRTPLVSGSAIRLEGQVACFTMAPNSHCYGCVSQLFGEQTQSCSESGVLSPIVGLIGSIQATEALKIIAGLPSKLTEQLLLVDGLSMEFNRFNIVKNKHCSVCSA
ncbi:molybdopterin-synthase adenylyltransferase MoeB [uncultured Pseudoalteromonas sp.]|uniref:HesA/MoeB/ThiF family protein n=1 Tax=uncultured Pseudoalteromonas sp. TaxID=114053 RepID=UPI0025946BA8|nr:molybdopterin-synthase adenylyltransferase MoeB [uncultured Pseudoalteromonas sp.]